jgi:hypothetical protein
MHEIDAGRIFWKEWRAQRSFWIGLFALALGLEFLLIFCGTHWGPANPADLFHFCQGLVIVLACSFATGSAAIAFSGEIEAKTKGLLQRLPVRPRDLLVGKLSLSLAGSYALLVALWLASGLMLMASHAKPMLPRTQAEILSENAAFWQMGLAPFLFVVIGSLFSLVLSDVLFTVLIAGAAGAALSAIPMFRDQVAVQAAVIAIVVLCDFLLARRWLRDTAATEWSMVLPRRTPPPVMSYPSRPVIRSSILIERSRSAVAWRRAASSLIWKEFRQAFPFCLKLLVGGLIALVCVPIANRPNWNGGIIPLILVVFAPLLPGIAAVRAERRDNAFRMLANRGVAPDGFVICKHLVWLSLSLLLFAVLLLVDRSLLGSGRAVIWHPDRMPFLWESAAHTANATFDAPETSVMAPLAVAAFHVVLLYALGFLLGLLLPGPILAFFAGAILWLGLAFCWLLVAFLRIPFWWTIGLFPVIFLAVAWVRTSDWLIGRNTLSAGAKAVAVFVIPLVGIFVETAIYRVTEIPAVAVPPAVLESGAVSRPGLAANAKQSLFVDAIAALSGGPPTMQPELYQLTVPDGWEYATREEKDWVAQNMQARTRALEAAEREPGSFPAETAMSAVGLVDAKFSTLPRMWWLAQLLLFSARQLESENRLDEALSCYVAVARLGSDFERSGVGPGVPGGGYTFLALNWMQRWAADPKQSTGRIKQAISKFEGFEQNAASPSTEILRDWQANRLLLHQTLWERSSADKTKQTVSELWWIRWLFPWEPVRLERLVDAIFAADLRETEAVESELRSQGFVLMTAERIARWDNRHAVPWKYERTTLAPPDSVQLPYWGPEQYVNRLATERMDLIALAIAAEAREHHKRPDSLRALVPAYFQRVPVDPWTGGEFVYEPQGVPANIDFEGQRLAAGTPFLASAGKLDSRIVRKINPSNGKPSIEIISRLASPEEFRRRVEYAIFSGPMVRLQEPVVKGRARARAKTAIFNDRRLAN